MKKPIRNLHYQDIAQILKENDRRIIFEKTNIVPESDDLKAMLEEYVGYPEMMRKSVLGLDIYRYSSFGTFEQTLIPFLFKTFIYKTIQLCKENHAFVFQKYTEKDIDEQFISTGDGGFFIFDTPLHSLLFATNFAMVLRVYNAFHMYPKMRKIIGAINLRYAITYDKIYTFDGNFYGRAIINNARILIKDDLNRCLIDENVHTWFMTNMEGVENLQIITIDDVANIYDFSQNYDKSILEQYPDAVFGKENSRNDGIINSDILKIGTISSKETELSIYNLHLQITQELHNDDDPNQKKMITISLGNLNTSGV